MATTVEKAGEKFTLHGKKYTAKSFFGNSGIEYPTAKEATENNEPGSLISVKNKEKGGSSPIEYSIKIDRK
jgi:hypothetical protein